MPKALPKTNYKCLDCKKRFYLRSGDTKACYFCQSVNMQEVIKKIPTEADLLKKEIRTLKKALQEISDDIFAYTDLFDKTMTEPQTVERGKKLALITNAIHMSAEAIRYFSLGIKKPVKKPIKSARLYSNIQWLKSDHRKELIEHLKEEEARNYSIERK